MVWRKTSPLARQLLQFSEVVRLSAGALRKQHNPRSASHKSSKSAKDASADRR
jgi:LysR family hydrogen peroxide-inducible transcriptional activator